jgi:TetR/AcrR family transcriptional regulator
MVAASGASPYLNRMVNPNGQTREADTERRILDAAHEVFFRRGTAGARMQEIADEAGVNKALLHYYFRSKERLADAVFERAAKRLLPPLLAIMGSDAELEAKVERAIAHYLEVLSDSPALPGYVLSELHYHPDRIRRLLATATGGAPEGFAVGVLTKLGEQIGERVRTGTMRPIGPEQFAVNLISLCLFPFAARPMFRVAFGWDDAAFGSFIEARRRELPAFFLDALRP